MSALLESILTSPPAAYALLHRPEATGPDRLDVLAGETSRPASLARVPRAGRESGRRSGRGGARHEQLLLVPYRQITERGYACRDDGEPLLSMTVTDQDTVPLAHALDRLPEVPATLAGGHFDVTDTDYARTVRDVVRDAIGTGAGANFVIRRSFVADITDYGPHSALSFFRRLLEGERRGAYWTFLVHTGRRTFVGASPERHVSVRAGLAVMNPISGTYAYPPTGPTLSGVMGFLRDRKETDELCMVVDEELKMMSRFCAPGIRLRGPYLKEMSRLAHTEYFIEGRTREDVRTVLRESLFAPTVTGSPLESACRVIARYENSGRGYYSGVAALVGRDEHGEQTLDSAILIRTADIDAGGRVRIGVGSTLVRHSWPADEVAETRAKAQGVLSALEGGAAASRPTRASPLAAHPRVRAALERRNDTLAGFWLRGTGGAPSAEEGPSGTAGLAGSSVLVVDMEDTFTAMIAHQLRSLGLRVTVRRFDEPYRFAAHDLTVLGPGPGDPADCGDPRIERLRHAVHTLLRESRPFVAVCLSHQVLSLRLGLSIVRREVPNQGVQQEIGLFGRRARVGLYNTYAAHSPADTVSVEGVGSVEVARDEVTGEVHALRGPHFASMQFHAESMLTQDGPRLLARALSDARGHRRTPMPAPSLPTPA